MPLVTYRKISKSYYRKEAGTFRMTAKHLQIFEIMLHSVVVDEFGHFAFIFYVTN